MSSEESRKNNNPVTWEHLIPLMVGSNKIISDVNLNHYKYFKYK